MKVKVVGLSGMLAEDLQASIPAEDKAVLGRWDEAAAAHAEERVEAKAPSFSSLHAGLLLSGLSVAAIAVAAIKLRRRDLRRPLQVFATQPSRDMQNILLE